MILEIAVGVLIGVIGGAFIVALAFNSGNSIEPRKPSIWGTEKEIPVLVALIIPPALLLLVGAFS